MMEVFTTLECKKPRISEAFIHWVGEIQISHHENNSELYFPFRQYIFLKNYLVNNLFSY